MTLTRAQTPNAAGEIRLAVSYVDYYALARTLVVVGGIPFLYALLYYVGNPSILRDSFVAQAPRMPYAALLGALVSLSDRIQLSKHRPACAEIERARRAAASSWSPAVLWEYHRVRRRYGRQLVVLSLVPLAPVLVLGPLGGFFGGLWLLGAVFGTEFLCWRLLWRPRLLDRASTLESAASGARESGGAV